MDMTLDKFTVETLHDLTTRLIDTKQLDVKLTETTPMKKIAFIPKSGKYMLMCIYFYDGSGSKTVGLSFINNRIESVFNFEMPLVSTIDRHGRETFAMTRHGFVRLANEFMSGINKNELRLGRVLNTLTNFIISMKFYGGAHDED